MMIADSDIRYEVMFRHKFMELTHASVDHIVWIIRQAIKELPVEFWDTNEDVARRKKTEEEGLECFFVPFGVLGQVYIVEVVPYPRQVLTILLRGVEDIQPIRGDPHTVIFPSELLREAPVKTRKELKLVKTAIDIESLRPDYRA
jgi:hypothetical protein